MSYNLNHPMATRSTKTVYRDNDKTIKLFVENYSKAAILNEALNQARVEENTDLNIPKLHEVLKIDGRWAIVSEYIEGRTLADLMDENSSRVQEYIAKFVDIQLEVLSYNVPLLNRIKDKYKRKITETTGIDDNTKYELLQRLEGMKDHTKLCHGDFNPSNIIIAEDGTYSIIDWSHVTQGNASADVALTYLQFKMDGKEELAESYLKLFSEKSGIEVETIQTWIPIVAAVELNKCDNKHRDFLIKCATVLEYQ